MDFIIGLVGIAGFFGILLVILFAIMDVSGCESDNAKKMERDIRFISAIQRAVMAMEKNSHIDKVSDEILRVRTALHFAKNALLLIERLDEPVELKVHRAIVARENIVEILKGKYDRVEQPEEVKQRPDT